MKKIQKIMSALLAIEMMAITAYAGDIDTKTQVRDVSTELSQNTGNSELPVNVVKRVGETSTTVYSGPLGGYEEGVWSSIDFSTIGLAIILEWDSNEVFYITPSSAIENVAERMNISEKNLRRVSGSSLNVSGGLEISSQIKINGVNVGEKGLRIIDNADMECIFSAENNSEDERSLCVVLATYTAEKRLYQVKQTEITVEPGASGNALMLYRFDAENESSAKLMFWNSTSGMLPVKTVIDFNQTDGVNAYYYDADNRLLQIDKANNKSIFFTYDNMGNLLTKTVEGEQ